MDALYVVALLTCPVGMGLMMWLMTRGRHGDRDGGAAQPTAQDAEIQQLRDELDELRHARRVSVRRSLRSESRP